ncbi:hypothetical protein SAMN06265784_101684 [Paraburkholderia susongensis]|uniref:Uncharacterized protein n=1 Tax=Paraburkholderia susongensis TaxID=1515439 RepID=A0A1X7IGU8_9BURK|nr:hypothetical protein SAMN06265784_101684 [Paraburkholderia susongensis]
MARDGSRSCVREFGERQRVRSWRTSSRPSVLRLRSPQAITRRTCRSSTAARRANSRALTSSAIVAPVRTTFQIPGWTKNTPRCRNVEPGPERAPRGGRKGTPARGRSQGLCAGPTLWPYCLPNRHSFAATIRFARALASASVGVPGFMSSTLPRTTASSTGPRAFSRCAYFSQGWGWASCCLLWVILLSIERRIADSGYWSRAFSCDSAKNR